MSGLRKMLSVIIPAYNEEENVKTIYLQLIKVLNKLKYIYEIIFIDDGSKDRTLQILKQLAKNDKKLKIISFNRNFGQSAAISAGFQCAKGNIIVTMDADLQNDPADIPKLLNKLGEGYDVVCGWRKKRNDPFVKKKLPSMISNFITSKLTGLKIHDFGCTFRVYKKQVVKDIGIYGEMHRYIPALALFEGYSVGEIEVKHNPRLRGETKYGISRIFKGLSDLITMSFIEKYGMRPGHFFTPIGIVSFIIGSLILTYLVAISLIYRVSIIRPALYVSMVLILGGIQFVIFGILSEMLTKIRYEIKHEKFYKVRGTFNL